MCKHIMHSLKITEEKLIKSYLEKKKYNKKTTELFISPF